MRPSAEILSLVISAIKNLRELKGSTSREILRYISSVYRIPPTAARRQMQNALKRGVTYGILKKGDGHYSLPTDNAIARHEVAVQEIGLLDLYRRRKNRMGVVGARRRKGAGRGRKSARRSRGLRSSSKRGKEECGCGGSGRRVGVRTTRSKFKPVPDVDRLTDKSTKSCRATTGVDVIGDIERSNRARMPSEQCDRSISLSC